MNQAVVIQKPLFRGVLFIFIVLTVATVMMLDTPTARATPGFAPAPHGTPLYSWGDNANGQLGLGDSGPGTQRTTPSRVGDADNWVQVSTSIGGAFAINAEGHLYAWGAVWTAPQMGQGDNLANPGTGLITVPTKVGDRDDWVHVQSGGDVVAALSESGHLYTWGASGNGNLGHGDTTPRNIPTRVGDKDNWATVSVGGSRIMGAITTEGHLYTWGWNSWGQLGQGSFGGPDQHTPLRVGVADNWKSLSVSGEFTLAINTEGKLFAWGGNGHGQLGQGDMAHRAVPTQIGTAANWIDITASTASAIAVNSQGEIWTWGNTAQGQLGRPVTGATPQHLPGRIGSRNDWVAIGGGNTHSLALTEGFELYAWGNNNNGQLGIGTMGGHEASPQFVLQTYGFAGFSQAGGGSHSMALVRTEPIEPDLFLSKQLQKPIGTPVPDLSFSFTFTPHSFNNNTANIGQLPTIPTRTVTISNSNTSTPDTPETGITTTANSVDVLEGIRFTQAGVYAWTVTEVQAATGIGSNSAVGFSQASYRLRVYVQRHPTQVGELYLYATTIHRLTDTAGALVNPPARVDYLNFTNTYMRTTPGTTEYPGALSLSKIVTGQFANVGTPFDFDVTLTRTAFCPPTIEFTGKVMQGNAQVGSDIVFTSGAMQAIALADGQRLVFDELVVGTRFSVTERAALEFAASATLFVNGQAVNVTPNAAPNTDLSIGEYFVGAERNTADFTNAHTMPLPTGFVAHNHAILLTPVAVIILLAHSACKVRKETPHQVRGDKG